MVGVEAGIKINKEHRRSIWAGHVARMEEGRSAFKIFTGKPPGKRHIERARRRL